MSRPGAEVLREVDRSLERVRGELDRAQEDYSYTEERLREFVDRRGEAILALAKHYLPVVDRATVDATFDGLRDDLLAVLRRKERRDRNLLDDLARQRSELQELIDQREAIDAEVAEIAADRERLLTEVAHTLAEDELFKETSKLALQAEERLNRNEERLAEVREDAERKLPSYDDSRLFRYLYDRGFGRDEYSGSGFTKRMDRWVADLVDYPALRHGYDFLRKTPELMEAEIVRRREDFEQLMEQVERIEREATESSGLPELDEREASLASRRERIVRDVASREKRVDRVTEVVEAVDREDDRFYREALERVRRFLDEAHTAVLEMRAAETPERTDDEIVSEITWLSTEIDGLRPELEVRSTERDEARRRTKGLEFLAKRFRQSSLDAANSVFPGTYDVRETIDRFLAGGIEQRDLWQQVRERQETEHGALAEVATEVGRSSSTGGLMWRAMAELGTAAAAHAISRTARRWSSRR